MRKIIFVDDDSLFLEILKHFFGSTPHCYVGDVRHIASVIATHGPFDGLVTDYNMPHQDGLALAQWMHGAHPEMPIIVLSAHEKPDQVPDYIKIWILKPINLDVLDQEIKKWT